MKILLANGTELHPIIVTGGGRFINSAKRDTLNFIFPETASLEELDSLFTDTNCESIRLYEDQVQEDGSIITLEHIHTGYVIRAELSRTPMVVKESTDTEEEVVENRITVSMALRTYQETQLASLTETVDYLVLDSLSDVE